MLKVIQFRAKTLHTLSLIFNKWFSTEFESKDTLLKKSLNFWRIVACFSSSRCWRKHVHLCMYILHDNPASLHHGTLPDDRISWLFPSLFSGCVNSSLFTFWLRWRESRKRWKKRFGFFLFLQHLHPINHQGTTLTLRWMARFHSHVTESSYFPSPASMPPQFLLPFCGIYETTSKWHPGFWSLHPLIYPENHCWAYLPKTAGFHINLLLSNLG